MDWVADYLERVEQHPVFPSVRPGEIRARLPAHAPEGPESFDAILADLDRVVLPGITHWQSPMFFGYFPANASWPATIGDLISSGLGVQGMMVTKYASVHGVDAIAQDFVTNYIALPPAQYYLAAAGGRFPANTIAGKHVTDPVLAEFGAAGKGGVPMPNIPQMSSVWSALGAAWVKSTKGSGSTKAVTAFKAAARSISDKIG